MGEAKWTPGPWRAWDRGIGWEVHAGPEDDRQPVNDGHRGTFDEADARLIAAAPDLYAALAEIQDVIAGAGLVEEFPVWIIDLMNAALAKANPAGPPSTPSAETPSVHESQIQEAQS
jgi:hypothetical protein